MGGLACAGVIVYAPRGPRRTTVQVAGLAGIALVVLAVMVAAVVSLR